MTKRSTRSQILIVYYPTIGIYHTLNYYHYLLDTKANNKYDFNDVVVYDSFL